MFRRSLWTCCWCAAALSFLSSVAMAQISLTSPDGKLAATFSIDGSGNLQYNLRRDGITTLLENSPLGVTVNSVDLGTSVNSLTGSAVTTVNDTFAMRGLHETGTRHYQQQTITVGRSGAGDATYQLNVRMFNDGVAYQYVVPGSGARTISGERSGWTLPTGSTMWFQNEAVGNANYESAYGQAGVGTFTTTAGAIGGPITFKLPGSAGYAAITESGTTGYSGMTFGATSGSNTIRAGFLDNSTWNVSGGTATPWRVTTVGANLNSLVNNDIVRAVAPAANPTYYSNQSYIKPGRSLWSWWANTSQGSAGTVAMHKSYIDQAASLGFEYYIMDEGWEGHWSSNVAASRIVDIGKYAKDKGIKLWIWKNQSQLDTPAERSNYFSFLNGINYTIDPTGNPTGNGPNKTIVGLKIDFFDSESQSRLGVYKDNSEYWASQQYMVNYHGANKNAGEEITFPNEMTREGIRGLEYNKFAYEDNNASLANTAKHNATLPFTRMLAGSADYTPGTFNPAKLFGTTYTHQMALGVTLTSPLLVWAEEPAVMNAALPVNSVQREVFKNIESTWDETVVIAGSEIGDLAMFARRKGNDWMLGFLNGDGAHARVIHNVDLSFLGANLYDADLLFDGNLATSFDVRQLFRVQGNTLDLDVPMLAGGGFVAHFRYISAVPEPSTIVLVGLSLGALVSLASRRRRVR